MKKGYSCDEFFLNGMVPFWFNGVFCFPGVSDLVNTGHPILERYSLYKQYILYGVYRMSLASEDIASTYVVRLGNDEDGQLCISLHC